MYSHVYPDITEAGIDQLKQTAKELHTYFSVPHRIIASPAVRAQGSAHILAQELGYHGEVMTEPLLSDMAYADWPAAKIIFEQCRLECEGVENIYDTDARFEDASIFEPRSSVQRRFYLYLEQLTNYLKQAADPLSILVVSHFEVLNHFIQNCFPDAPWIGAGKSFLLDIEQITDDTYSDAFVLYENFSKQVSLTHLPAYKSQNSLIIANDSLKA